MTDEKPNIWQRMFRWLRPKTQTVELGIVTEHSTASSVQAVTGSVGLAAGSATVRAVGTVIEPDEQSARWGSARWGVDRWVDDAETPAQSTDGDVYVEPDPAELTASAGDPSVLMRPSDPGQMPPYLEGGVTEPPHSGDTDTQRSTGTPRLDAAQVQRQILQAFRGDKAIIIAWTDRALDNVALLGYAIKGSGINNEETRTDLRNLIADQTEAIANIRHLVAAGATDEAAAEYERSISRWITIAEKYLHNSTVTSTIKFMRGFIAAGVAIWMDPAVAASPSGWIITAVISGIGLDELKALGGYKKKKD